jgi:hypothetical protein
MRLLLHILPNRQEVTDGRIEYTRIDQYLDFPSLKTTGKARCLFCRLLRKTIRSTWETEPFHERGVGAIIAKDGLWADILG